MFSIIYHESFLQLNSVGQVELLDAQDPEGRSILDEQDEAAAAAVESFPQRETNRSGDRTTAFLAGGGGFELGKPTDCVIVVETPPSVLPLRAIRLHPLLVQGDHHLHHRSLTFIHLQPQAPCHGDFKRIRRCPLKAGLINISINT